MADRKNQGEGNREAAERYDEDTRKFVESGKVGPAAEAAKRAIESGEEDELRRAEEAGKGRMKEDDPAVKRDYGKGS
jgi:hypothetical protein